MSTDNPENGGTGIPLEQRLSTQKKNEGDMAVDEASNGESLDVELDPAMERKLLIKLDMAFVPIIMLTYLSCFLDRSNIGKIGHPPHEVHY